MGHSGWALGGKGSGTHSMAGLERSSTCVGKVVVKFVPV